MRHGVIATVAAALAAALLLPAAAGADAGQLKAGVAVVDATWHVGASAGQYATTRDADGADQFHEFDPGLHSYKNKPSYGVQSRLEARALVIEEAGGERLAVVKNDLYIPQDLLWRRTAQILESKNIGIGRTNLVMSVTHSHSSPYYSSTAWGAWTFQDVFDVRFYEYYAQRMADAVEKAAGALRPVRVGAATTTIDKPQRNALGPAVADDGTPAGFPNSYTDHDMAVVRFDDAATGKPYALWLSYSLHGEFLEGNDLISADWVGPTQRMLDRATGATTIFTQNAVGTTEPERSSYHSVHERLEFSHKEYGQAEYASRLMSDAALGAWRAVASGDAAVPFMSTGTVKMADRWFPGPLSHPYPSVSNCHTDAALAGQPGVPIAGLPDCERVPLGELADPVFELTGQDPGLSTDTLEQAGIPVPENYSAPSYTGLEEDVGVHLQAFRVGPILFTVCSCEQWADQAKNIKTRTDTTAGNEWLGYDWGSRCTGNADGTWTCPNPGDDGATSLPPVSDLEYRRMRAQVNNQANGWNEPDYLPWAESEPADPAQIKGNYTHDDTPGNAQAGYRLTVPISMANDYNGYLATYREYQRGDHYRKALTGWGPHSSDYFATRLVGLGRSLNGGDAPPAEPLDAKATADLAHNDARATALGEVGGAGAQAYEDALPDDGGKAEAVTQPTDVERFGAALFTWNGGDNYVDDPQVVVQRRVDGEWRPYADQSGEVPVTLKFPAREDAPAYLAGEQRWEWTATFEAFVSQFDLTAKDGRAERATPVGTYRFVVSGRRRDGGATVSYPLVSKEFEVRPWSGITVDDLRVDGDGRAAFTVGPRHTIPVTSGTPAIDATIGPIDYPDTYASPVRFVHHERTAVRDPAAPGDASKLEWYCLTCSFRPWLDAGDAVRTTFTFVRPNGKTRAVRAVARNGRWVSQDPLRPGESAFVARGSVVDAWGNYNGAASATVG